MEEAVKNIELIDKFIENERRSKMWTTISVAIFCLLGGAVFFLAYALNKSNAKYKVQNIELQATQVKLDSTLKLLAAKNESLQGDSLTLSNQVVVAEGRSDSLKKFCDTVTLLFKNSGASILDGDTSDVNNNLNHLGQSIFNKENLVLSDNLRKVIQDPVKWNTIEKPDYIIHLRYMPVYGKEAFSVAEQLKGEEFNGEKYQIAGVDSIQKISFNPLVKYFRDEDEGLANKIAEQINGSGGEFFKKSPATIQKLTVKAPLHQIEVWVGRYKLRDMKTLIMESSKYKILSQQ